MYANYVERVAVVVFVVEVSAVGVFVAGEFAAGASVAGASVAAAFVAAAFAAAAFAAADIAVVQEPIKLYIKLFQKYSSTQIIGKNIPVDDVVRVHAVEAIFRNINIRKLTGNARQTIKL